LPKALEKFMKMHYNTCKVVHCMEIKFTDYKTVTETAAEWGISRRMVIRYCEHGRIPGAMKGGNLWLLPRDAEKPPDRRAGNRRQPKKSPTQEEPII
jgi:hypothetical protein